MTPEQRVQLLILVAFGIAIVFNLGACIYTYRSRALKRTMAQERPFTRAGVKGVVALVVVNIVGLVLLTVLWLLRNYFVLPVVVAEGQWFVPLIIAASAVVFYAVSVWPATMLFYLSWAIKEHDRLINMKLKRHKEAARNQRRGRGARAN